MASLKDTLWMCLRQNTAAKNVGPALRRPDKIQCNRSEGEREVHSVDSQDSDVTPNGSLLIQFPIVLNPEKDTQHLHPNEAATTCCIRIN